MHCTGTKGGARLLLAKPCEMLGLSDFISFVLFPPSVTSISGGFVICNRVHAKHDFDKKKKTSRADQKKDRASNVKIAICLGSLYSAVLSPMSLFQGHLL